MLKSAGPTSSAGRRERRLLRAVTMVQTALTLALLVGAGLLIRTMSNLASVSTGLQHRTCPDDDRHRRAGRWSDFHVRALERVSSVPGIQQAAFAWGVPLTGNNWPGDVEIEGRPVTKPADRIAVPLRSVTPGYFSILGLTIAEGRDFRSSDTRTAPGVAIVNRSLVDRYFGGAQPDRQEALDARTAAAADRSHRRGDRTAAPPISRAPAEPEIYLSLWQATAFSKDLVVRAAGNPRPAGAAVQRELRAVDPTVAVENVRTLEQIRGDSLASRTLRDAAAGRVLARGQPAHSRRDIQRLVARRRRTAPRDRHPRGRRRPAAGHSKPGLRRRPATGRRRRRHGRRRGGRCCRACSHRSCLGSSRPIRVRWPASGCCSPPSRCSPAGCRRAALRRSIRWKRCARVADRTFWTK